MAKFDKQFWDDMYINDDAGWDLGEISTPLKTYIDQLTDKSIRILIPGAGNSHEAEFLHKKGFDNVSVVDISPSAIKNLKERVPSFEKSKVRCEDFFEFEGEFDLILEQTFFCAINPELRQKYAEKCNSLLVKGGKIAGLMFQFPLTEDGPPFGGSREEYEKYFNPFFDIKVMEEAHNSMERRAGREMFVIMNKK